MAGPSISLYVAQGATRGGEREFAVIGIVIGIVTVTDIVTVAVTDIVTVADIVTSAVTDIVSDTVSDKSYRYRYRYRCLLPLLLTLPLPPWLPSLTVTRRWSTLGGRCSRSSRRSSGKTEKT